MEDVFVAGNESPRSSTPARRDDHDGSPAKSASRGFGFAALRDKANVQDRFVEKLLSQVLPDMDNTGSDVPLSTDPSAPLFASRPPFSLPTMSTNFRRFNARIGVVFHFQARALSVLSWRRPTHTLSLLAVFTFVCLDPFMLPLLPLAGMIVGVLVPAFVARHPAPPGGVMSSAQGMGYSPRGPPLAPPRTVRPVRELSKDFFRNMRDLQNVMEDFSRAHDHVVSLLLPVANFSDEARSSAVFLLLAAGAVLMMLTSHLLPWRALFLVTGWATVLSCHPAVARAVAGAREEHVSPHESLARTCWDNWLANDVILDSAPETREVEIFELQRLASSSSSWPPSEYQPWLFSPSPYDPLSQPRLARERPVGSRFFEDVKPPEGWVWSEKKWALDQWSREWVEERIITGVEVETEGERWVYDMAKDEDGQRAGMVVVDHEKEKVRPKAREGPSWEEGDGEAGGRRGEWRRRRWVRLVKRRMSEGGC